MTCKTSYQDNELAIQLSKLYILSVTVRKKYTGLVLDADVVLQAQGIWSQDLKHSDHVF